VNERQLRRLRLPQVRSMIERGDAEGAIAEAQKALEKAEAQEGDRREEIAACTRDLAELRIMTGDAKQAESLMRSSLEMTEAALGEHHPDTELAIDRVADLCFARQDYAAAEPVMRRALEMAERKPGGEERIGKCLNRMAALHDRKGELDRLEPLLRRAAEVTEAALGPEHPDTAESLQCWAKECVRTENSAKAKELYSRAVAIREAALGKDHPGTAESLGHLGNVHFQDGEYAEATEMFERAVGIVRDTPAAHESDAALWTSALCNIHCALGRHEKGKRMFPLLLELTENLPGDRLLVMAMNMKSIAHHCITNKDNDSAFSMCERAVRLREMALGTDHPEVAADVLDLGVVLLSLDKPALALEQFRLAHETYGRACGPKHEGTKKAGQLATQLEAFLKERGRDPAEAGKAGRAG